MGVDFKQLNSLIATYYNEGEFVSTDTDTKLKNAMSSLFDEMDNGGVKDGKLSKDDGLTSAYESLFGITDSKFLTKQEFLGQIDTYVNKLGNERATLDNNYRNPDFKAPLSAEGAKEEGKNLYNLLKGDTENYKYQIANESLAKINKNNVVDFIKGFNTANEGKSWTNEGIIEFLDDEWDGGALEFTNKKNIITSLLEAAKEKGLENTNEYKIIKAIIKQYEENGPCADAKDFRGNRKVDWTKVITGGIVSENDLTTLTSVTGGTIAAGAAIKKIGFKGLAKMGLKGLLKFTGVGYAIGAAAGALDYTRDCERLDKAIEALINKMN